MSLRLPTGLRPSWPSVVVFACIAVTLFVVGALIPSLDVFDVPDAGEQGETVEGTVTRVLEERVEPSPRGDVHYRRLEARLGDRLVTTEQRFTADDPVALDVGPGDEIVLGVAEGPEGESFVIIDMVRKTPLLLLALGFAVLVLAVGRWRGLMSLLGLGATFLVIVQFVLPGILSGADPVLMAVLGALVIVLTTLYLAHGVSAKTTVALAGTALALGLTVAAAHFSIRFADLTGLADEGAATLRIVSEGEIDPRGLLLAGVIIGALGVLDDVTTTQASAVFELRGANPALGPGELFRRGMNVGRDHIASTVNTLVLAYAGAALPLLVVLALQTESLGDTLNREFLATEIVRTLVGSMGIVAAVPITSWLAALSASRLLPQAATETRMPEH